MYISRNIEKIIEKQSKRFKILILIGAREVGKTSLLKNLAFSANRKYVSLKDLIIRDLALTDPPLFLQRYAPPVIIDDIQYAPPLFQYIKNYANKKDFTGSIWITSSQLFPLLENTIQNSYENIGVINLLGLSLDEIYKSGNNIPFLPTLENLNQIANNKNTQNLNSIYKLIWQGSFPAFYKNDTNIDWQSYYSSYVQNLLQQDISKLLQINDEMVFFRFLCAAASQTGRIVNYAELAKAAGISAPTAKQWVKILEAAKIVYMLQPFMPPGSKYVVKAPKIFFYDTGLAAYLTRWNNPDSLETGAQSNDFFTTWVIMEIYKSYSNICIIPPIYYLRNFNGKEIGLIIYINKIAYPIIIDKSANPEKATKLFSILEPVAHDANISIGPGAVICFIDALTTSTKNIHYVPAWII